MIKLDGDILRVSGSDIDWEELQLTVEQAVAENNRIVDQVVAWTLMQIKDIPETVGKAYFENAVACQRKFQGSYHLLMLCLASVCNLIIQPVKLLCNR